MWWLPKFVYGKVKTPRKRKRRLLVFVAALIMFVGVAFQTVFKWNTEGFLLAGFGVYTMSELYE